MGIEHCSVESLLLSENLDRFIVAKLTLQTFSGTVGYSFPYMQSWQDHLWLTSVLRLYIFSGRNIVKFNLKSFMLVSASNRNRNSLD